MKKLISKNKIISSNEMNGVVSNLELVSGSSLIKLDTINMSDGSDAIGTMQPLDCPTSTC